MILLDSSVLVDHFRNKDKKATFFYRLTGDESNFAISTVTKYEVLIGSKDTTDAFWQSFLHSFKVLPFDDQCADKAIEIYKDLKLRSKLIDLADILIAATALAYQLPLATLNLNHFERITGLKIQEKR